MTRATTTFSNLACILALVAANSCATEASNGVGSSTSGGTSSSGGTGGTTASNESTLGSSPGLTNQNSTVISLGPPNTTLAPGCTKEVCDGLDNDCDGIVDNVDVNHDGVCDCLRLATLGKPGASGVGNVFKAWLAARSNAGADNLGDQVVTYDLIKDYQVVIIQDLYNGGAAHTYSASEVKALSDFVNAGNGLMTLTGYSISEERKNVNSILSAFGISYGSAGVFYGGGRTVPVDQLFTHPTTENVKSIGVDNGYEVLGDGTLIAAVKGVRAGVVKEVGTGRIVVWGDEWITYDTEWLNHPDYQVERFWLNVIKWLTPTQICQVALPPIVL